MSIMEMFVVVSKRRWSFGTDLFGSNDGFRRVRRRVCCAVRDAKPERWRYSRMGVQSTERCPVCALFDCFNLAVYPNPVAYYFALSSTLADYSTVLMRK
jgi:hypothetical protein